jgi:uncharacterized lipoprotein YmbA
LKRKRIFRTLAVSLIGLFLISCAAKEALPNFFLLTHGSAGRTRSGQSGGTAVFVRRVDVPAYLAKGHLVTLKGGIQVEYSTTASWAEPLDQGVARAVAENLSRSPRIRAVGFSPEAPLADHKYEVWIRLERFEGNDNGEVVLRAHWAVSSADSSEPIASRTVDIRRHGWQTGDYPGLVRLLSEELAEMSHGIARSIP